MGPCAQTRRQFALVRKTFALSSFVSFNSFSRSFRNSHDSSPSFCVQHFGLVWSAQRKIWRWIRLMPNDLTSFFSVFSKSLIGWNGEQTRSFSAANQQFCVCVEMHNYPSAEF